MRKFYLNRLVDETGVSGTGRVTEGYELSSGVCVMKWLTETSSIAFYTNIDHVIAIHGHGGKTVVEWADPVDHGPIWVYDPMLYLEETS